MSDEAARGRKCELAAELIDKGETRKMFLKVCYTTIAHHRAQESGDERGERERVGPRKGI